MLTKILMPLNEDEKKHTKCIINKFCKIWRVYNYGHWNQPNVVTMATKTMFLVTRATTRQ